MRVAFLGFLPAPFLWYTIVDMDGFGAGGDIREAPNTEDHKQLGDANTGSTSLSGIFSLGICILILLFWFIFDSACAHRSPLSRTLV